MAGFSIYRLAQAICVAAVLGQNVLAVPQNQGNQGQGKGQGKPVPEIKSTATVNTQVATIATVSTTEAATAVVLPDTVKVTTSTLPGGDIMMM